jgi:hypothetical protein
LGRRRTGAILRREPRYDSRLYSPLFLLLGAALLVIALR